MGAWGTLAILGVTIAQMKKKSDGQESRSCVHLSQGFIPNTQMTFGVRQILWWAASLVSLHPPDTMALSFPTALTIKNVTKHHQESPGGTISPVES